MFSETAARSIYDFKNEIHRVCLVYQVTKVKGAKIEERFTTEKQKRLLVLKFCDAVVAVQKSFLKTKQDDNHADVTQFIFAERSMKISQIKNNLCNLHATKEKSIICTKLRSIFRRLYISNKKLNYARQHLLFDAFCTLGKYSV